MNDLLLSKVRLAVIAELLSAEWLSFSELKMTMDVSNGNLGAHVGKLVEAGYVQERKRFIRRRPQSQYRLTGLGRTDMLRHVADLQALVDTQR